VIYALIKNNVTRSTMNIKITSAKRRSEDNYADL